MHTLPDRSRPSLLLQNDRVKHVLRLDLLRRDVRRCKVRSSRRCTIWVQLALLLRPRRRHVLARPILDDLGEIPGVAQHALRSLGELLIFLTTTTGTTASEGASVLTFARDCEPGRQFWCRRVEISSSNHDGRSEVPPRTFCALLLSRSHVFS
eukprot:SAG11_NODE_2501_length_3281_cov_1.563168_3_plen_153_part_00